MNNHRYHAVKPNKDKYIKLKYVLNLFAHKELNEYILNNYLMKGLYEFMYSLLLLALLKNNVFYLNTVKHGDDSNDYFIVCIFLIISILIFDCNK